MSELLRHGEVRLSSAFYRFAQRFEVGFRTTSSNSNPLNGRATLAPHTEFGEVRATLASFEHEITPEVSFGGERVVRRAVQRKVLGSGRSTTRERLVMVELQSRRLATAFAAFVHEGTAMPVPLEDRTTNDSRHVPPALARQAGGVFVGGRGSFCLVSSVAADGARWFGGVCGERRRRLG